MNTVNEKKTEPAPGYKPTDDDLPTFFSESPQKRSFADAEREAAKQLHELLGLNVTEQETTICSLVLYCHWQDELEKQGGSVDGDRKKS